MATERTVVRGRLPTSYANIRVLGIRSMDPGQCWGGNNRMRIKIFFNLLISFSKHFVKYTYSYPPMIYFQQDILEWVIPIS